MRQGVPDMVFSTLPDCVQSPTTQLANGLFTSGWDGRLETAYGTTSQAFYDTSGDGDQNGVMDFGGQDMMLHDFGAALAQADDMSVW